MYYWHSYVSHDPPQGKFLPLQLTNTLWFYVDEINNMKSKVKVNSQSRTMIGLAKPVSTVQYILQNSLFCAPEEYHILLIDPCRIC